ncbi:hypothetical protein [Halodesulfovibrio sp.]|uniref:hypothetical protein n=1 Tax=Halodesulfovibrio sp. TaxID=1912772 RepID=UPI0025DA99C5|nr:hypothetical protein [Halodesulfovibrio sp.]MCT4625635.1 hypothetical protein [Halodesulfovibrio sp.]
MRREESMAQAIKNGQEKYDLGHILDKKIYIGIWNYFGKNNDLRRVRGDSEC